MNIVLFGVKGCGKTTFGKLVAKKLGRAFMDTDSITILAVIGCFAEGETIITNAAIARHKECDRIHAITTELKKMGAAIEEREDGLVVRRSDLKGATLETYHDHRMAMSLTIAALGAEGESIIQGSECASKTYPHFKKHLQKLGATIRLQTCHFSCW